ncbi:hypothetical protein CQW23_03602 [Capsicum baccatum]|uniref:Uncharacterized protein n=1 Tax=Capsicum baccatum TaxID=33114 RepID=A0A2G2XC81_CAPBA|nr:hypothetical protein CQW23_03602 [Capsicum baccatum]
MKVDSQFGIVEIKKRGSYYKFNPFIFPQTATQVYYANHRERKGNKANSWVVIKTNPKGSVDTRYNLEVAYQEEQSRFSSSIEDDRINCLHNDQADEGDEDISNEEEKGDEETSSEEANDEEEETNEEEDFFDSEDSASHFHTHEEDKDEYEKD